MQTILNPERLQAAIEYTDKNFFSKPYSISPIVDRWFNQLAMIQLENGKMVSVSGQDGWNNVDIILNDEPVTNMTSSWFVSFMRKVPNMKKIYERFWMISIRSPKKLILQKKIPSNITI